jgi:hypothetical protein
VNSQKKSISGRGNSKGKGPKEEACLACSRNSKEVADVAKAKRKREK